MVFIHMNYSLTMVLKILFVCHGNICRSPMAEAILSHLLCIQKKSDRCTVDSAATSEEEILHGVGNPIYPPAKRELEAHGILDFTHHATRLQKADYDRYDLLIGMDFANLRNMQRICGGDPQRKMHLLLDFTDRRGEVADPWYSDRFDLAYDEILRG